MENKNTYQHLIAPVESQMIRSIWRIVRDPDEAADTLQEALATTWKKLDRVRAHPNPHAFILKICIDAAYDTLRKRQRHHTQEDPEVLHKVKASSDGSVSDKMIRKEIENEILHAVSRLPRKQASAVLMRIVQDEPYENIAIALGCSEATVRTHVLRGRDRLKQWLAHLDPTTLLEVSP